MKLSLPNGVTSKVAVASLKLQDKSPHILFGAGIVLMGATVITACKATLKLEETLDNHNDHIEWADGQEPETSAREKTVAYVVTGRKLARLYGPSLLLGTASVVCLTQSHRIMTRRNVALTASYTALDKAYRAYRERVKAEVGEEREYELYRDVETRQVSQKGTKNKATIQKSKGGGAYERFFDDMNRNWDSNPDYRLAFLRLSQNQLNDQLNAKGHIFLNEVYDHLGFERTEAGQIVGWVSSAYKESKDGYIDFGVFSDRSMENFYLFASGQEGIWLDFNVDGPVAALLNKI